MICGREMGNEIMMIDLIYDTLFNNKQNEQFDANKAENQCLNYSENEIEFEYNGKQYFLKLYEGDKDVNELCDILGELLENPEGAMVSSIARELKSVRITN